MSKIQHKQCNTNYEQKEMACKQPNEIEFWTLREKNNMQNLMCCWKGKGNTKFHYYIMSHLLQKQSHFASIRMIAKAIVEIVLIS